ncbi:LCP family protein [Saccharopolyspora griseoalba]|uniref:LCP family protein n=1 Tax=Saccharopolyspora griseoalba TaxID=1431848 RepID=A0ABW2LJA5_9PSEU
MEDRPRRSGGPAGRPDKPVPPRGAAGRPPRADSSRAGGAAEGGPKPKGRPGKSARSSAAAVPPDDVWDKPRRSGRTAVLAGRTATALLSVVVLVATGFAWSIFGGAANTGTADVISDKLRAPDGATDILLIGNDSRTDSHGNPLPDEVLQQLNTSDDEGGDLTDAMILVRIPNNGKGAAAMSFPRDTMVDSGMGDGQHKLTETLKRGKAAAAAELEQEGGYSPEEIEDKSTKEGKKLLLQTIEKLSGVSVDHYAEVNLLGFYEITKAVGGVEVCLKEPTQDSYSGADFQAGVQTIQGSDALAFVRQRHGLLNELSRGKRQQVFMSGLAHKILSSGTLTNPSKLNNLVKAINKSVTLDPELANDILGFAQKMSNADPANIQFYSAPVHLVGESGEEEVTINIPEAKRFASNLLLPPKQRAQKMSQLADPTTLAVNVYNASGISGLAANVSEELADQGFQEGEAANAESRPDTVVYHAQGEESGAQLVADALGGVRTEMKPDLESGQVDVYLGSDYKGPGKQAFSGSAELRLDGFRAAGPMKAQNNVNDQEITADGVPCVE